MSQSQDTDGAFAMWQSRDLPYDEAFDNAVLAVLEHPPTANDGLTILHDSSSDEPQHGISVRARDIDHGSLPRLSIHDLPLSLDDPRRVYASPVPGIRLSHPGGYLQGGPGATPDDHRDFAHDFISQYDITTPEQLSLAVEDQVTHNLALAKERMQARNEALQHNARIEKEIKTLTDQREMEVKIETRMKDDARKRRETREKKRQHAV